MVRSPRQSVWLSAVSLAALACIGQQAVAAENGLQRYSPGIGGSDMTAPLTPGLYLQVPLVHYHARKLRGGDHDTATGPTGIPAVPGLRSKIDDAYSPKLIQTVRGMGYTLDVPDAC